MKRFVLVAAAVVVAGCGAGRQAQWDTSNKPADGEMAGDAASGVMEEAAKAWENRGDEASLRSAIEGWEKVVAANPGDAQTHAMLARAWYFLADAHLRGDKEKYLAAFEKGVAAGERGLAAASPAFKQEVTGGVPFEQAVKKVGKEGLESMYWYASNLGKWARAKGFATTLGNKDKIKSAMDRALELDPTYFHGAPHRYFGAFYAVAPGFAGGDMNKSKEHYEKSLEIAPGYVGTKVLYADTYAVKKQDRALFDRLLEEVLAAPDDVIPGLEPETRNEKEKAQELKSKATELF